MNRRTFISFTAVLVAGFPFKAKSEPALKAPCGLKVGDRFSFRTSPSGSASAPISYQTDRGLAVVPPLPIQQTVRVVNETQGDGRPSLVLAVERTVPAFVPGSRDRSYAETITAHIDKSTGDVFDARTTTTIDGSVSNSTQSMLSGDSTLADFYGAWMLDLSDGYNQSNASYRGSVTTLTVTGRAKVAGADCFVVAETKTVPSGDKVQTVFWVDTRRRVALKTLRAGSQMLLVR